MHQLHPIHNQTSSLMLKIQQRMKQIFNPKSCTQTRKTKKKDHCKTKRFCPESKM